MRLIECVANISEGRRSALIEAIARSVEETPGVKLLHIDRSEAAHRSVITFAGEPAKIGDAAFRFIGAAASHIDMRTHRGIHPRLGAVDVIPFVPLGSATVAECTALIRALGRRIGHELSLPVYLYGEAATSAARWQLHRIRAGEYEGLTAKLRLPDWRPDFGPAVFHPQSGAVIMGARPILIAYNINIETDDVAVARRIAVQLRESGDGRQKGRCPNCLAIGWTVAEFGMCQVSTNLTDYQTTPPHVVYETVRQLAAEEGMAIRGSEVVGLIPLAALSMAAAFYEPDRSRSVDPDQIVQIATQHLGLDSVKPFTRHHILDLVLQEKFGSS